MGISRSPTIIMGYLMLKCQYKFEDALQVVQSARYQAMPRIEFQNVLRDLEVEETNVQPAHGITTEN